MITVEMDARSSGNIYFSAKDRESNGSHGSGISILDNAPETLMKPSLSFGDPPSFKNQVRVPFKWEAEPGRPKNPVSTSLITPLQPPPCLSRDTSARIGSSTRLFDEQPPCLSRDTNARIGSSTRLPNVQPPPYLSRDTSARIGSSTRLFDAHAAPASPRTVSDRLKQIFQLKHAASAPSPRTSSSPRTGSPLFFKQEHRSSPISVFDGPSSPTSSASSPIYCARAHSLDSSPLGYPTEFLSIARSSRSSDMGYENWDKRLQPLQGSASCGFRTLFMGCLSKPRADSEVWESGPKKKMERKGSMILFAPLRLLSPPRRDDHHQDQEQADDHDLYQYQHQHQLQEQHQDQAQDQEPEPEPEREPEQEQEPRRPSVYMECFKYEDDNGDVHQEEDEDGEMIQPENAEEVHSVGGGAFAFTPVAAAFVYPKASPVHPLRLRSAMKKPNSGPGHVRKGSRHVRFIDDYSRSGSELSSGSSSEDDS